jgi:predicted ATP-dependent endonuclease of OLD family
LQEDARFKFNPNYIPPAGSSNKVLPANQRISTDENSKSTFSLDITYERHDGSKQNTSHLTVLPERGLTLITEQSNRQYKAIFLAAKKHTAPKETSEWFSEFVKESREGEIVEFLKIIEPRLETLKVVQEGPGASIHGKLQGLARTLDIHFMGEGMEKLLNIALAIAQTPGSSIFVDEFENGLHYSSLPKIWSAISQMLVKYDCQLFTSTHSHECIRSAHEGLKEMSSSFRYIRLDRSTGNIEAKIFNYEMLGDALISNLEIR